jgi:hypothetical protein
MFLFISIVLTLFLSLVLFTRSIDCHSTLINSSFFKSWKIWFKVVLLQSLHLSLKINMKVDPKNS